MTVGGVDTYYDYDEKQWKFRRLGGGPIHPKPVCPTQKSASEEEPEPATEPHPLSRPKKNSRATA